MSEMPEFFQFLASMGVGGILAGFMFIVHNRTLKEHAEIIKGYHEIEKGRVEMLLEVIIENTKQPVANIGVLKSLHKRLDSNIAYKNCDGV